MATNTTVIHHATANSSVEAIRASCEAVALADPGDTQKIASVMLEMSLNYYEAVRKQANRSFTVALVLAVVGTVFFVAASGFVMERSGSTAYISLIAGALVQVISGINFYLYGKASRQFATFHVCLERMNRFLVTNSICANLKNDDKRDETRAQLIKIMAQAPMLTLDGEYDRPRVRAAVHP